MTPARRLQNLPISGAPGRRALHMRHYFLEIGFHGWKKKAMEIEEKM